MQAAQETDRRVRGTVYRRIAERGTAPSLAEVAHDAGFSAGEVAAAYRRLAAERLLVLESDGETIRMAPPFSGVPTPHRVDSGRVSYFANCAWDALGVPLALGRPGTVHSRCAASGEPLRLDVSVAGPPRSDWLFHSLLPAARWWDDIVFT